MNLPLLLHCQVPTAHLVVVTRAACIHHQSAFWSERRFEGQVNGVRATGNFSNRSHRSVQHDSIASPDAQVAKVIRQFLYRMHSNAPRHPPQGDRGTRWTRYVSPQNCCNRLCVPLSPFYLRVRRPAIQKIGCRTIRPYAMNAMRRPSTPLKIMGATSRYLTCTQTNTRLSTPRTVAARIVSGGCQWNAAGTMSPTVHTSSTMPTFTNIFRMSTAKAGTALLTLYIAS